MLPHRFQDTKGSFSWSAPSGSSRTTIICWKNQPLYGMWTTTAKKNLETTFKLSTFSSLVLTLENASVNCEGGARGNNNSHRFLVPHRCCTLFSLSPLLLRMFRKRSISSRLASKRKRGASRSSPISSFRSLPLSMRVLNDCIKKLHVFILFFCAYIHAVRRQTYSYVGLGQISIADIGALSIHSGADVMQVSFNPVHEGEDIFDFVLCETQSWAEMRSRYRQLRLYFR